MRQKANPQVCGEPGTGGAGTAGRNESPGRDIVLVSGFPALVPHLEGNWSLRVETEQGCISFSTGPVKTCNTGICLST